MGEPTQVQNQLPDRGRLAIDFKLLARKDEDFKSIWQKSSGHLNFQDPGTCQALTKAILKTKFGLQLDIPDDRLCPPVPVRWDYVTWVQALVESTRGDYLDIAEEKSSQANQEILDEDDNKTTPQPEKKEGRKITGLDIGTGASAIYTLLLLATRPSWRMCATDTDKKSFDYAARNLALNNMLTRTTLLQTTPSMPLMPLPSLLGTHDDNEYLDFTICNPPFFADDAEMAASLKGEGKAAAPNAVCTGSVSEMVCEGGDLGFVKRMVEESFVLRGKVGWYTSMLGKLASAKAIVEMLKEKGVRNWAVGCLEPGVVAGGGGGTKRWAVGWSFGERRPRNVSVRLFLFLFLLLYLGGRRHVFVCS